MYAPCQSQFINPDYETAICYDCRQVCDEDDLKEHRDEWLCDSCHQCALEVEADKFEEHLFEDYMTERRRA